MPNFMTQATHEKLFNEMKNIQEKEIPAISKAKLLAAQEGDLSENAEYIGCKEKLDQLHARYANLQQRLGGVSFIDNLKIPCSVVSVGTRISLEDLASHEKVSYTLLGSEDVDVENNIISISSPLAKNFIGKKVGDKVVVKNSETTKEYKLIQIKHFKDA